MSQQIPKIIHYCWFGPKKMPENVLKCMESWSEFLPDYKIILWNEKNFDVNCNLYVTQAYEAQKYAFVTDYVRLYVLLNYGGIYMDTDVEVLRNLDPFLEHSAFSGTESEKYVPTGIIGAKKNHPWIKRLFRYYDTANFKNSDGSLNLRTNVQVITEITLKEYGWIPEDKTQKIKDDVYLYSSEFFCPYNWLTKELKLTNNSYCIHHFHGSWITRKSFISRLRSSIHNSLYTILNHFLGRKRYESFKKLILRRKYS
ncbi:glycosyltransferase family 32 protein [Litchfieldia alkalitelluris]|uniref:glycosyltransferase family 32 protein n=1 Tax=Litchfieldia alkalitelluris TaxID=304268 RepID=UPI000996347D|nr:glycosyltransferase [Litchfieldia alkalitelluris]